MGVFLVGGAIQMDEDGTFVPGTAAERRCWPAPAKPFTFMLVSVATLERRVTRNFIPYPIFCLETHCLIGRQFCCPLHVCRRELETGTLFNRASQKNKGPQCRAFIRRRSFMSKVAHIVSKLVV